MPITLGNTNITSSNFLSLGTNNTERIRIAGNGKILAAAGTNWVGTVSQNGLSSVIERGSNANGEFVKYADGTLICHRGHSWGSDGSVTWNYPVAFSGAPQPLIIGHLNSGENPSGIGAVGCQSPGTSSVVMRKQTAGARSCSVIAIGRWY